MLCFEVSINGKRVCLAGIGDFGVLSAILTWVKRNPSRCPKGMNKAKWCEEELSFNVGGLVSQINKDDSQPNWIDRSLKPGDKIVIRIWNRPECDPPQKRRKTII